MPETITDLGAAETDGAFIQRLIDQATAALGREIGIYLGTPDATIEMHRGGTPLIVLYDDPIAVGEELDPVATVETRDTPTDPWEEADADDYVLEGRTVRHRNRWPRWVRVTYQHGFEVGEGPAEFRQIVFQMVESAWLSNHDDGLKSESLGDHSWTKADVVTAAGGPADWERLASRWRRQRI